MRNPIVSILFLVIQSILLSKHSSRFLVYVEGQQCRLAGLITFPRCRPLLSGLPRFTGWFSYPSARSLECMGNITLKISA